MTMQQVAKDQAFPAAETVHNHFAPGLTKRELAAIELRVPMSGDDEIDVMIRVSNRRDFAAIAMQGLVGNGQYSRNSSAGIANEAFQLADAFIATLEEAK